MCVIPLYNNIHRYTKPQFCKRKMVISVKQSVLGAQKNHLIETVLLSTHRICYG